MSTPTFFVPPPAAEEVVRRLEDEFQRQQDAPPEPTFRNEIVDQSYKWICEIEHNRFTPKEVDEYRTEIYEPSYWEYEARYLKDQLSELIWNNLRCEYVVAGARADGWQNLARPTHVD